MLVFGCAIAPKEQMHGYLHCCGIGDGNSGLCRMFVLRYLQVVGLAPGPRLTVGPGAQPVWPGIDVMTVLVVPWLQQDMARMVA